MGNISNEIHEGDVYGRWTVISEQYIRKSGHRAYLCRCSCDKHTERYVDEQNLKRGKSIGCGCLTAKSARERFSTHGGTKTRLYRLWCGIKSRCYNPRNKRYADYGGRGIEMCPEWKDFSAFSEWSYANGYDENLSWKECSIDRKDNNKGYSPDNCKWSNIYEQSNNKRSNVVIEHNGERKTAAEWSRACGIDSHVIRKRLHDGKSVEEIFSTKSRVIIIEYNGESHTLSEWSEITGIKKATLWLRYKKGMPLEDIFSNKYLYKKGGKKNGY